MGIPGRPVSRNLFLVPCPPHPLPTPKILGGAFQDEPSQVHPEQSLSPAPERLWQGGPANHAGGAVSILCAVLLRPSAGSASSWCPLVRWLGLLAVGLLTHTLQLPYPNNPAPSKAGAPPPARVLYFKAALCSDIPG